MRPAIQQLSSRTVYRNQWMTVREDAVERLDGSQGIYAVIDKPDFALIIPEEEDGFHLVEQYRYPVGQRMWEFPQGTLPDRQDSEPAELARLELAQETGLRSGSLRYIGRLHCAHSMTGQAFSVFHASDLAQGPTSRDIEEQDMKHSWFSRQDFEAMIADGVITDDSTVSAYGLLLLQQQR
jgi:8-oxo-dGTP pyrophosphatase MutT (NUDIX family)